MDFTPQTYKSLLLALSSAGYSFLTFEAYCNIQQSETPKFVILRHDIDASPLNALKFAHIEAQLKIRATYYFRAKSATECPEIIRDIASLGHEVGYHYESLTQHHGNIPNAIADFTQNLALLRTIAPISTASMHGVALSKHNNLDIWQFTSLTDHSLIGEPYLTIDYSKLFYITDTGRRWDGYRVSLRDKIRQYQDQWTAQGLSYRTTTDIIRAINNNTFPHRLMMTTHPQRWTNSRVDWLRELISQRLKNLIKRILISLQK